MTSVDLSAFAELDWTALSIRWVLTLGHFLWQGATVGLLLALVLGFRSRATAQTRYVISLTALISLIPCVVLTYAWVDVEAFRDGRDRPRDAVSVPSRPDSGIGQFAPSSDIESHDSISSVPTTGSDRDGRADSFNDPAAADQASSGDRKTDMPATSAPIPRLAPWIATGYLFGVLLLLARTGVGAWGGRRFQAKSEPVQCSQLLRLIAQQATLVGLKTVPVVAYCARVSAPTVVGLIKPMVLLPAVVTTGLEPNQLAAILRHEFAHIRRYDLVVILVQRVIESLLFFHPVVWWISRRVSLERENCCDDLAAAKGTRLQYAGALLRMAELSAELHGGKLASQLMAVSAAGASTSQLSLRIRRLLDETDMPRFAFSRFMSIGIAVAMLLTVAAIVVCTQFDVTSSNGADATFQASFAGSTQRSDDSDRPTPPVLLHGFDLAGYRSSESWDDVRKVNAMFDRERAIAEGGSWRCWVDSARNYSQWMVYYSPSSNTFYVRDRIDHQLYGPIAGDAIELLKLLDGSSDLVAAEADPQNLKRAADLHQRRIESLLEAENDSLRAHGLRAVVRLGDLKINEWPGWSSRVEKIANSNSARGELSQLVDAATEYLASQHARIESLKVEIAASEYEPGREPTSAELAANWGPAQDGLSLAVAEWPREIRQFEVGDRLKITLSVRNVSDTTKRISTLDVLDGVNAIVTDESTQLSARIGLPVFTGWPLTERYLLQPGEVVAAKQFEVLIREGDLHPPEKKYNPQRLETTRGSIKLRPQRVVRLDIQLTMPSATQHNADGGITLPAKGEFDGQLTAGPVRLELRRDDQTDPKTASPRAVGPSSASETESAEYRTVRLIDGMTGKPLSGIRCRVNARPTAGADSKPIELTSDDHGRINVPIRGGHAETIDVVTPGWWQGPMLVAVTAKGSTDTPKGESKPRDPTAPIELKLWQGEIVVGRLLYPDKTPAAGVLLNVGVYLSNQTWKKRLGMDLTWYSWDHGDWPNWTHRVVTNEDGMFETTVPPEDARLWVRVGTTALLGMGLTNTDGIASAWETCIPFEAQIGGSKNSAPVVSETNRPAPHLADDVLDFGDLQLQSGVIVHGRVVDTEGNGLEGVRLTTPGLHGPHSGRSATSGENGAFRFLPIASGWLTIRPDARLRDANGKVVSRDVQAVFVDESFEIPDSNEPVELVIQAVPHVDLEFDWQDRRTEQGPVSYYGRFIVNGFYPLNSGQLARWRGETNLIERDGRQLLIVKTPIDLQKSVLNLPRDRVVTASYEDETGTSAGPGRVDLGDIRKPLRRTIFGDEPQKQ